eukprot:jgi/Tetstr1/461488/TSEL_006594.t1
MAACRRPAPPRRQSVVRPAALLLVLLTCLPAASLAEVSSALHRRQATEKPPPSCTSAAACGTGICSEGRCACPALLGGAASGGVCQAATTGWCLPPLKQLQGSRAALIFELAAVAEGSKSSSAAKWMSRVFGSAPRAISASQMGHFTLHGGNALALKMLGTKAGTELPGTDLPALMDLSRCAVVGSSRALLGSDSGAEIDSHTAVIRFNQAPTAGYEAHVGSRTTLRIQNSFAAGSGDSDVCLLRLSSAKKANKHGQNAGRLQRGAGRAGAGCRLVQLSPQFEAYRRMLWYNMAPPSASKWSSGFMGIALAVNMCSNVTIYGFDFGPEYYFPKEHRKQGDQAVAAGHPWELERQCAHALAQLPSVTWRR